MVDGPRIRDKDTRSTASTQVASILIVVAVLVPAIVLGAFPGPGTTLLGGSTVTTTLYDWEGINDTSYPTTTGQHVTYFPYCEPGPPGGNTNDGILEVASFLTGPPAISGDFSTHAVGPLTAGACSAGGGPFPPTLSFIGSPSFASNDVVVFVVKQSHAAFLSSNVAKVSWSWDFSFAPDFMGVVAFSSPSLVVEQTGWRFSTRDDFSFFGINVRALLGSYVPVPGASGTFTHQITAADQAEISALPSPAVVQGVAVVFHWYTGSGSPGGHDDFTVPNSMDFDLQFVGETIVPPTVVTVDPSATISQFGLFLMIWNVLVLIPSAIIMLDFITWEQVLGFERRLRRRPPRGRG